MPAQRMFVFEDSAVEWVYSCAASKLREPRWRAHLVVKKTDKRIHVTRRSIPVEDLATDKTAALETARPYQIPRQLFERQGWYRHSCKGNSCFYASPGMERHPSPDELAEERGKAREARQREQEAWKAANPDAWAERQRQAEEAVRRMWAEAEEQMRRLIAGGSDGHDIDARLLGVSWPCSPDELRSAYRRLAKQTHPDRGGSAEAFRRVKEAYERLTKSVRHP